MGHSNWIDVAQVVAAVGAVAAAVAIPVTTFLRRPKPSIVEDVDVIHSRVEGNDVPYIRVLVSNARLRRASHGTRVLVEQYRENRPGAEITTMGHPALTWPSAPEATDNNALSIFAGATRPIGLGRLIPNYLGGGEGVSRPARNADGIWIAAKLEDDDVRWSLWLQLPFVITDGRDVLPPSPNGYVITLLVGADDGAARRFDCHVNWSPTASTPQRALDSFQIAVTRRR